MAPTVGDIVTRRVPVSDHERLTALHAVDAAQYVGLDVRGLSVVEAIEAIDEAEAKARAKKGPSVSKPKPMQTATQKKPGLKLVWDSNAA